MSSSVNHHVFIPEHIHNLADFMVESFKTYAEKPAYTCLGQTLSFAEIDEKSQALACWLQQESGLNAGDRVAIQLPNLNQYPIVAFAILRAGMIIVNTNPLYTPAEMQHQFKNSGAKCIIILQDLLPKLEAILDSSFIEKVVVTGPADLITGTTENIGPNQIGFTQTLEAGKALTLQPIQSKLDDIALLQYTGGTTGVSKGACITHRNVIANAQQTLDRLSSYCGKGIDTYICPLPLYHSYAFTVNMIMYASNGNQNILIPNPRDIDSFVDALKGVKFTGFAGLNTLFVALCQHPEFQKLDFSQLRLTTSGGTTLTSATADLWFNTTGCTISEGYGLSETGPVLNFNDPANVIVGTVGRPVMDTEIALWDPNDQPVNDGEEGQVVARGPQIMQGYWNMPEETDKVLTKDGWFKTGDIGALQENDVLKIVDRLKDMIIVSGFNVYPNQVEDILTNHPKILEAAVVGKSDGKSGERVCAYITVTGPIDIDEVTAYSKQYLTGYKVPKEITVLSELPKSTVGKILRRELRDQQ